MSGAKTTRVGSRFVGLVLAGLLLALVAGGSSGANERPTIDGDVFRPELVLPEWVTPFEPYLHAGKDEFVEEAAALEIEDRLAVLRTALETRGPAGADAIRQLLTPDFRGGRLLPAQETGAANGGPLQVVRAGSIPADPVLTAGAFEDELRRLLGNLTRIRVAELIVSAAELPAEGAARTEVRYDISGTGQGAERLQHVGHWRMTWRRDERGWHIGEWTAASHVSNRASAPIFTEITGEALGSNASFREQLSTDLDTWMSTLDIVLTRDSNGHHGVAVGDFDGDGLDDLYVAQPSGLPNRLFRNRGDGTFEDVTERAGVGLLDDTAMALFVDVDNDGDQDLVIATPMRPQLFLNDGTGRFTHVPEAFRFARPLQGSITSIAMADYDRDGFLDLYLCVYSYFYGAGEDKAGTPMPYHDARNGPPGVLFRNDGRGGFADVTSEAGLDEGNDRYHFAAAWADYDGDGWVDLLVVNDFGTNNLYRNRGDGTFEDVAGQAGVLDHAAGMSAAFLDYDNDGLLDIYTGNMWTASGRRVTTSPAFMPDAPPDVRALYQRHARGNSLFRNRGDGTFDDTTLKARAEMGRWAWSADVLDFDSDGWDDLLVVNGMLSREGRPESHEDLESFFWRQVVARSPLTRVKGTTYDDGWLAINQWLIHRSMASRQRNVVLRNDGRGGFDDVSGVSGLDLDHDGRAFGVIDLDGDGRPDLVLMGARQAPQLRVFRNDYDGPNASVALRLAGTTSNRDAIGARVVVEAGHLRRTRVLHAGSGFLSQHSKELLIGLGASERIQRLTVHWPSGETQVFTDLPVNVRVRVVEGGQIETEVLEEGRAKALPHVRDDGRAEALPHVPQAPGLRASWLYEPFPAPDFSLTDVTGVERSLTALRGRPGVLLFWATESQRSRAALDRLARGYRALADAGIGALAITLDSASAKGTVGKSPSAKATGDRDLPVAHATKEVALSYAIMNRYLFMNRQDLVLPTVMLLDRDGRVVKVYRETVDVAAIEADAAVTEAPPAERLARAMPFAGRFYAPPPSRSFLSYGRELLDQGLDAAALLAFERAAQASPSAETLYRLGTLLAKTGETARARATYERALAMQPDLAEASNDLGTLLARDGDLEGAIRLFRAALAAMPDYPDALNNLGYALLLMGHEHDARGLYERALALQPDFPEALNNLGMLYGRAGDMDRAERHFREALARRQGYGDAANNLALVLVARGDAPGAVALLESLVERTPEFEPAYLTLARIHLSADRVREGLHALERLLQRNPTHPVALELLREWRPRPN